MPDRSHAGRLARRWASVAVIGGALAACAAPSAPMWPGSDWRTASAPATEPAGSAAPAPETVGDETPVKVPKHPTRRGSGAPPDILFGNPERFTRPEGVQQIPAPAYAPSPPGNAVLMPVDPKAPYSADGFGYQRQGMTIVGPTGGTYQKVGPGIFGPNGSSCHTVGNSLFC